MSVIIGFLIIALCLFVQGFLSSTEMAVISSSRLRMLHRSEQGDKRAKVVLDLLAHPEKLLSTTLVGVNLAAVTGASVASGLAVRAFGDGGAIIATVIMVPLFVVFGEIVPMGFARQRPNRYTLQNIPALIWAYRIMYPLVKVAAAISGGVTRLARAGTKQKPFMTRDELRILLENEARTEGFTPDEAEMAREVLDFGITQVRSIMTPLIDVDAADSRQKVGDLLEIVRAKRHSRIPIYEDRVDNITGVVHITHLLGEPEDRPVRELARRPYYVAEVMTIDDVLNAFQNNRRKMAIVVNEYGGASGVVTLEDIIEEIVGEISDEYDPVEKRRIQRRGDVYFVDGKTPVSELNEELDLELPEDRAETIGGLMVAALGKMPRTGDRVVVEKWEISAEAATNRLVEKVKIRRKGAKS
ncbi:MAG: HlyC/CorC family transporter [Candidatus Omnitrophica bacterium]|nr:HlyC/CorC family transporter [Candidatus Omnitrophota bacterium]